MKTAILLVFLNLTSAQVDGSERAPYIPEEMRGLESVILVEHTIETMAKCKRIMRMAKMPRGFDLDCVKASEWE